MIARASIVVLAVLVACKGKDPPRVATRSLEIPSVTTAAVLAPDDGKPPPTLLIVDEAGTVAVNKVATWTDVSTKDLRIGAKVNHLPAVDRSVPEPLPPGEADEEEEEYEPGTIYEPAVGKMGKKDTDRDQGQYRMRKEGERAARADRGPLLRSLARRRDDEPRRAADVAGEIIDDGPLVPLDELLLVPRTLKATTVVDLVTVTSAAIAVAYAGRIRPLRIQFDAAGSFARPKRWIEARVSVSDVTIEAVPDVPIAVSSLDQLAAALEKARTTRGTEPTAPVDVLVDAGVDAQRLVDVLVALDTAGVRAIGLGIALSPEDAKLRGKRFPSVRFGHPNRQGDLDKAEIEKVITAVKPQLLACYTDGLAKDPTLAGTVNTQFFITPLGKVVSVSASGVNPDVANCVEGVIEPLQFPKPNGGGGVQVSYPFTMRP